MATDDFLRCARTFPGNPYDGHILSAQLEQANILLEDVGRTPRHVVVELGFRGVDDDNPGVEIIHRGRFKSLTNLQRRWLRRRQAVEPAIGHLKGDHRMDRCWLAGSTGDALHAVLCAAGFNLRWLLRAIIRGRIKPFFWACFLWCLACVHAVRAMMSLPGARNCPVPTNRTPTPRRKWVECAVI